MGLNQNFHVMAGLGRAWPGHPRLACGAKVVDGRHKAGHDGGEIGAAISESGLEHRAAQGGGQRKYAWPAAICKITIDICPRYTMLISPCSPRGVFRRRSVGGNF